MIIDIISFDKFCQISSFRFRKQRDCTTYVVKTKALISCAVTAQLICAFVFNMHKAGFLMTGLLCLLFQGIADHWWGKCERSGGCSGTRGKSST